MPPWVAPSTDRPLGAVFAIETELKFQVPRGQRGLLRQAVATATAATTRLQAVYADTAGLHLAAAGMALRLRKEGRVWVQTLKGRGDGLASRFEHEVVLTGMHGVALYGSLFFGAVGKIEDLADQVPVGTHTLVLDLQRLVLMDTSGLDAMQQLQRTLKRQGVGMVLAHVNEQPLALMQRTGFVALLGAGHVVDSVAAALSAVAVPASSLQAPSASAP